MRQKGQLIRINIYISIIAITLAAIADGLSENFAALGFVSNALLGVFGSSLATMAVFCYEYQNEKRKVLKEYRENIESIQYLCSNLQYVSISDNKTIASTLLVRDTHNGKTPLQSILGAYLQIRPYLPIMRNLYEQIDFFSDHSLLKWLKKGYLLLHRKNAEQLVAIKLFTIQNLLIEFLGGISEYSQKHVLWYCQGFLSCQNIAIENLLVLQRLCFDDGGNVVSQRWYECFTSLTQS